MASEAVLSVIWTKKLYGLAFFQRRVDSRAGYQDEWGQDHIGHGGGQVSGQNSCIVGFLFIISPPPVRSIREELRNEVTAMSKQLADFVPGLRIVQVGGREDSNVYIRRCSTTIWHSRFAGRWPARASWSNWWPNWVSSGF